ncbi:hypothetical protein K435DRAFT_808261 [Dendrothele bispora CBS 962.96]|uniref:Uncharacterized protein n=1 Tax=Dendrothele bispora (strain CBS 962.96) TaxID=1314807 RepID=A0A4S8L290_DENBC|nr:hypothetical protein K435DRAFT_808261 [Dendrothele bispora CBS 962.96]
MESTLEFAKLIFLLPTPTIVPQPSPMLWPPLALYRVYELNGTLDNRSRVPLSSTPRHPTSASVRSESPESVSLGKGKTVKPRENDDEEETVLLDKNGGDGQENIRLVRQSILEDEPSWVLDSSKPPKVKKLRGRSTVSRRNFNLPLQIRLQLPIAYRKRECELEGKRGYSRWMGIQSLYDPSLSTFTYAPQKVSKAVEKRTMAHPSYLLPSIPSRYCEQRDGCESYTLRYVRQDMDNWRFSDVPGHSRKPFSRQPTPTSGNGFSSGSRSLIILTFVMTGILYGFTNANAHISIWPSSSRGAAGKKRASSGEDAKEPPSSDVHSTSTQRTLGARFACTRCTPSAQKRTPGTRWASRQRAFRLEKRDEKQISFYKYGKLVEK